MDPPPKQTSLKLVLLGEAAVGKSSLVLRFVSNDFQSNKEPTIGAAFLTQKCTLPSGKTVKFEIWDTAGQERFAALAPMYYRNAGAAVVVYDVAKAGSFVKARQWVNELKSQGKGTMIIALVGNKVDLINSSEEADEDADEDGDEETVRRMVSEDEGKQLANDEGLLFFETSAKTGLNVREVFMAIAQKIPDEKKPNANASDGDSNTGATSGGRVDLTSDAPVDKNNCSC